MTISTSSSIVPTVTISGSTTLCQGASVTYTAAGTNGGSTPAYQWKVNGTNAGNDSSAFTSNALANADVVSCVYTSSSQCASPGSATSNLLTVSVQPSVSATAAVTVSPSDVVCANTNVEFTAALANGGATPATAWLVNGNKVDSNTLTYSPTNLQTGDIVSVQLTSDAACVAQAIVVSNTIVMTIHALPAAPVISQSGNVLTSSAVTGNQWYFADNSISGATTRSYTINTSGYYTVEVTDVNGCSNTSDSIYAGYLGITSLTLGDAVQVLPNPFRDNLWVNISGDIKDIHLLGMTVTDETGRQVYENNNVDYRNIVNLKSLAAGVYFLNISAGKEMASFKIVKLNW